MGENSPNLVTLPATKTFDKMRKLGEREITDVVKKLLAQPTYLSL
jgi:hypothetical protein